MFLRLSRSFWTEFLSKNTASVRKKFFRSSKKLLLDGIFIKEYGKRPEEVFSKFERKPLSAASFGQVHAAWLAEGEPASPDASQGRKVALKVQRPFVAEDFSMDARFFSFLAWVIGKTGIVKTVDP